MSTYADIKGQVIRNLGNRDDDETLALVMFNTNTVLQWLASKHSWPELEGVATPALGAGKASYTKAELGLATMRGQKVYSIIVDLGTRWSEPLTFISPGKFDRKAKQTDSGTQGIPSTYTQFAGKFEFSPMPSAIYELEIKYYKKVGLVTADNSPIIYEDLDAVIVAMVTGLCWPSLGDTSQSQVWLKLAKELLSDFGVDVTSSPDFDKGGSLNVVASPAWQDPFFRG